MMMICIIDVISNRAEFVLMQFEVVLIFPGFFLCDGGPNILFSQFCVLYLLICYAVSTDIFYFLAQDIF